MISINLSGKVALVTGGKTGIGEGIVALLLDAGANVVSGDLGYEKEFECVSERLTVAQLDVAAFPISGTQMEQACPDVNIKPILSMSICLELVVQYSGFGLNSL